MGQASKAGEEMNNVLVAQSRAPGPNREAEESRSSEDTPIRPPSTTVEGK